MCTALCSVLVLKTFWPILRLRCMSSERKDAVCTEGDDTAEGAGGGGDEENVGFGAIWWWW